MLDHLKSEMRLAQARYEGYANDYRHPAPAYKVGDLVWLDARNLRTLRPSRKLDWKHQGRFTIKRVISPYAYELDLPSTMRCHPVFHVSLLDPVSTDAHPGHIPPEAPPVEVDGDAEWEVEEVLDSRVCGRGGRLQYLVKWVGYDAPSWEPADYLLHAQDSLREFHCRYPQKPGP